MGVRSCLLVALALLIAGVSSLFALSDTAAFYWIDTGASEVTKAAGMYSFASLLPGSYRVSVRNAGLGGRP
jgi:hypothetical protein